MKEVEEFLTPGLVSERLAGHADCLRRCKCFTDGIVLRLSCVEAGSAIARIDLQLTHHRLRKQRELQLAEQAGDYALQPASEVGSDTRGA